MSANNNKLTFNIPKLTWKCTYMCIKRKIKISNYLPTETHYRSISSQTPTTEQWCHAIGYLLFGAGVNLSQLFFRHFKLATIDFGNFLKLSNRISKALLANQPTWWFNDVSFHLTYKKTNNQNNNNNKRG